MRGLSRGLAVLEFITRKRGASFTEVRLGTGLSKSGVHRILTELIDSGHVWRGVAEGKYYASSLLALSTKGAQSFALVRAAHDPLRKLAEQVQWPSDLFVRDGADMILADTAQSMSPYALRASKIGSRAPILLSTVGHAALAEMPQEAREELFEELRRRGEWRRQLRLCDKAPAEIIADVQQRGFAVGAPYFSGNQPERTGFLAVAAPVVRRTNVVGAVRIWWRQSAEGARAKPNDFSDALKRATIAVADGLEAILSLGLATVSKLWK